jgi:hypothetical protein
MRGTYIRFEEPVYDTQIGYNKTYGTIACMSVPYVLEGNQAVMTLYSKTLQIPVMRGGPIVLV